ncbi:endopeptidase La [Mycoplasmoides genitalium]|uniref:Lon protease n=1 Tax=Mycoplasma genitalium (strain ATCC 33530 / DSM 19775 / NCTC 10195 / G37) TaxID=243273 RepID=LON_MYCGE|nr:endopeptidase La [Mycoplasmoides genitalium]P47481.1 RecName: Full=Lon protease; AltName: Full=ATP-dependent protease La [Mycoplasmoides genitalium G37]ABY79371.1 ATP-dependent protease La [synthetic Mycoplasma genitalium JCVI-1.0]AAC71460.1 ATP-dependent protease La [Mycoplasmoides genitalium G37]AFQ03070.1 ATP-dependent protease La [Mycoplasmoides genitalium M2321]AFQ04562.1 ATP-dependent protease La [Mycoplasmoides genitalium M2288]
MPVTKKSQILVVRGQVIFPFVPFSLDVGRPRSRKIIKALKTLKTKRLVLVTQKFTGEQNPEFNDIYHVGTLCEIDEIVDVPGVDSKTVDYRIKGRGLQRVLIEKFSDADINEVSYQLLNSTVKDEANVDRFLQRIFPEKEEIEQLMEGAEKFLELENISKTVNVPKGLKQLDIITFKLANLVPNTESIKQAILEENEIANRLEKIIQAGIEDLQKIQDYGRSKNKETEFDKLDSKITRKINEQLSRQQRDFYLREKLRIIREEIGISSKKEDEVASIRKKLDENPYPEAIKKRILSELEHYENSSSSSQESTLTKTYIDTLLNLPWWQKSKDNSDVKNLIKTLDKNHTGLDKVKERIVEYLAVQLRTQKNKGPIMCLVGPPGVGKSSLAKSIAEALDKKFVKISLGGVHDESEIRGHRKTYLGSMPGRILKGMTRAKVINPLFLLDEIDKMTSSNQGYPSGALLEVLDPELNNKFSDNYVEEDYDLSKVMFIATANYIEDIPEALLDRMEIIELTSYTEQEKIEIAKNHLIKRCLEDADLNSEELKFTDEAISYIIKFYTREAGVRQLERLIQQVVRKYIVAMQKDGIKQETIDVNAVKKYLKKEIFDHTMRDEVSLPGIVNGMAYTPTGGDLLPIEVTHVAGKGELILTGNLKQTMRESANVALGYVKANAERFNINPSLFKKIDINIHVPGGGIPKDGPSAGAALVTAIISSLTGKKVDPTVAMTGEITLRGKVLVIGGVKEKTISAYRGGVTTIFMPEKNERYLDEVPKEIVDKLNIIFVKEYSDIYNKLFS